MFTFTTKIPDDFDWTNQTEFTNKVCLTYTDTVLGDQSQDAEATWKDENKQGVVITKKAAPDGTKNSIAYEVRVDLSEIANLTAGETITLTDTLPDLMKFNDDATAKLVYVYQNSEDTSQGDAAITASDVADANARNFSFTVTDKMVAAVAAGSAASSWYKPTVVISYTASATAALTPKVSETGSVTIKKFWMDKGTYTTLAGSVFKIVRATYDADTGKMVDGAVIKDNIEVGVDGTITVENLKKDWIYALYETKAKDGYARRTDPYYFIIDDDDSVTLPSGITIEKFVNDENVLEYENQLEAVLYITKTVENEDWDNDKNDITFTVKKGDLVIATVNGADMTKNVGIYVAAINQLEEGEYTVTETIAAGGKTPKTVTYKVGVTAAKTGQEATGIILQADSYNTVAFTNTYTKKTGKIVITKTVLGNVDKAKVEAAISFKVTRTANGTSKTYRLSDFTYDTAGKIWTLELDAAPGGYQVEETRNAVGGLTLKKVQYEVDASGKVDGSLAFIHVSDGTSAKVAYENTYEKKTPTTPPSPWPPGPTHTDQGTPGTGDNSNLALWVILFAVSGMGLGLAVLAILDKKNKKK